MADTPIYRMTDPDSGKFTLVRIIRRYYAKLGASNFESPVAEIEIVETGERLKEIPAGRLTREPE